MTHWPEYLIEGALLGLFMVSACMTGVLLEHPASPVRRRLPQGWVRRALAGLAMGLTAVALIYSPWGARSGAHMNPATTLTFFLRGKIAARDALSYIAAQFAGGALGVALSSLVLRRTLRHQAVNFVVTLPGPRGRSAAWLAELAISFGMMLTVLVASNDVRLAPYTGLFAGALLVFYITGEAPLSGMSLNPARTFASAVAARRWDAFWVYLTAPVLGMLLAAPVYSALPGARRVYCAKLNHAGAHRCIFRCEHGELDNLRAAAAPLTDAAH